MSKKSVKKRNIIIACVAGTGLIALLLFPKIMLYWSSLNRTENQEDKAFYLNKSVELNALADLLEKEGLISSKSDFVKVGNYKSMNAENIALGKYIIAPGTSYRNLLNGFKMNAAGNGNAEVEVEVTFNNCKTIYQMAGKVSDCIALDSARLIGFLQDGNTLAKYQFDLAQLPALFIPNTYKMYYDTDEKQFVERMAMEFKTFWNPSRKAKMKAIGLKTPSQVTTMASIVYAEQSVNADEWPIIAGLYLNRVKVGMRLQSDPTFKFCWGDKLNGVQRLLAIHREINCPYNTYKYDGLPPGPINLPSSAVLDAVLNRADVPYLYMCAKPDYTGRHNFAVGGADHMRNAKLFQNWMTAEKKRKSN